MAERLRVVIIGSGNIGSDLMAKVRRSDALELVGMAGIDPDSPGLARAEEAGITTSSVGLEDLLSKVSGVDLAFDATSAVRPRGARPHPRRARDPFGRPHPRRPWTGRDPGGQHRRPSRRP